MPMPSHPAPVPLPPDLAFVVQLQASDPPQALAGRVEHISSGYAARFASLDELLDFFKNTTLPSREPRHGS